MFKKRLTIFFIYIITTGITMADGMPYLGLGLNLQHADGFTALMPTWYGGYGTLFGCAQLYYAGGELYIEYPSVPLSGNQAKRVIYDYGMSGLFGIYIRPSQLFYLRVGLQSSYINQYGVIQTGGSLGLGMQITWNDKWDIRGEYVYVGQGIISHFASMQSSNVKFGLVYKLY